jgi:phage terminase Nu1 subunit (DNA packaging protein)
MPRRARQEENESDRQLVNEYLLATRQCLPALLKEDEVSKILGLSIPGVQQASKLGLLVPAHEGQYKIKQFHVSDVIKLYYNRAGLRRVAHLTAEVIQLKNEKAKLSRQIKNAAPPEAVTR